MTEVSLLKAAIENTADLIDRGSKQMPTDLLPIWEMLRDGLGLVEKLKGGDFMYDIFCCAAEEYCRSHRIEFDQAFSIVIDAIGIGTYSAEWYRVMAYHYQRQADRAAISDEIIVSLMDRVANAEGTRLLAEAERLNADPNAAVPDAVRERALGAIENALGEEASMSQ